LRQAAAAADEAAHFDEVVPLDAGRLLDEARSAKEAVATGTTILLRTVVQPEPGPGNRKEQDGHGNEGHSSTYDREIRERHQE
jgi:hypothetical protein